MKYTTNYHLPQWNEDDLILMDDFNRMNANIENGISSNASGIAEAKEAAEKARVAAVGAKNAADSAMAARPYAAGSYVGTGERLSVNVGFRPSFVIISGMYAVYSANNVGDYVRYFALSGGNVLTDRVSFNDTGFTVHPMPNTSSPVFYLYPDLTDRRTYDYIAFQ